MLHTVLKGEGPFVRKPPFGTLPAFETLLEMNLCPFLCREQRTTCDALVCRYTGPYLMNHAMFVSFVCSNLLTCPLVCTCLPGLIRFPTNNPFPFGFVWGRLHVVHPRLVV